MRLATGKYSLNGPHKSLAALTLVFAIYSNTAAAYISTGSDGIFHPTASTVLDVSNPIFNFTDIFIPNGVTVSFSGVVSSQPIELLATGSIDIAGTLDGGPNSLWIQTPGTITLSGSLFAGSLNLSSDTSLTWSGSSTTGEGNITLSGGGGGGVVLCVFSSDCTVLQPPLNGTPSPIEISGPVGGGLLCLGNCDLAPPVPEPQSYAMLIVGLYVLNKVVRRKKGTKEGTKGVSVI